MKKIELTLEIIQHPSDKQFPKAAIMRIKQGDKVWVEAMELDFEYKTGDTGLQPQHLAKLFSRMAKLLENYQGHT